MRDDESPCAAMRAAAPAGSGVGVAAQGSRIHLDALLRASGLPWIEARMLAEYACGFTPVEAAMRLRDPVDARQQAAFEHLAARRRRGEPVAYLLGERAFYGRAFLVTPDVLIPRPETEMLCEALLERLSGPLPLRAASVLDLGTGSGAIAVTLACERPQWQLTAIDRSSAALALAQRNAERLCPAASIRFAASDWFAALGEGRWDAIVSNPPYIALHDAHLDAGDLRFEPPTALRAGTDGLDALRTIAAGASEHLSANGWLLLEHGHDQGAAVRKLFDSHGFRHIETLRDLAGHERVTLGRCRAEAATAAPCATPA